VGCVTAQPARAGRRQPVHRLGSAVVAERRHRLAVLGRAAPRVLRRTGRSRVQLRPSLSSTYRAGHDELTQPGGPVPNPVAKQCNASAHERLEDCWGSASGTARRCRPSRRQCDGCQTFRDVSPDDDGDAQARSAAGRAQDAPARHSSNRPSWATSARRLARTSSCSRCRCQAGLPASRP